MNYNFDGMDIKVCRHLNGGIGSFSYKILVELPGNKKPKGYKFRKEE